MRSQCILLILGACASACMSQEAACENGDDSCALLQGGVGVLSRHDEGHVGEHEPQKKAAEQHSKTIDHKKQTVEEHSKPIHDQGRGDQHHSPKQNLDLHSKDTGDEQGWPDIFKKVTQVLGGADQLAKDFDAVRDSVDEFNKGVSEDVKHLVDSVDSSMKIEDIRAKVSNTYETIHSKAVKLWEALVKVTTTYVNGIGKVAPQQFTSAMKTALSKISDEGKMFADSLETAANQLKGINEKEICDKVKHGLHSVMKQASALAHSVTGMSTNGMSKDLQDAIKVLPDALQKEVEKVTKKANQASDHFLSQIAPAMKEIARSVSKAFEGHCEVVHDGAAQLQVGTLSVLVISAVNLFA